MWLKTQELYVSYRVEAGSKPPRWKALRFRLRTPRGDGSYIYGCDLITPTSTDLDGALTRALSVLLKAGVFDVVVIYDPIITQEKPARRSARYLKGMFKEYAA